MFMRKILLLLPFLSLLFSFSSNGQAYSGPPVGTKWYYTQLASTYNTGGVWILEVTADTTIFTRPCKVTRLSYKEQNISSLERVDYVQFAGKQVFMYDAPLKSFVTLYDFDAKAGDTVYCHFRPRNHLSEGALVEYFYRVDTVFTAMYNGTPVTQQNVSWNAKNQYDFRDKVLWEKVGSLRFFFPQASTQTPSTGPIRCYEEPKQLSIHFVNYPCDSIPLTTSTKDLAFGNMVANVYPNPTTTGEWTLSWSDNPNGGYLARLTNALGASVWSSPTLREREIQIPATGLPTGVYWLTLTDQEGGQTVRKLMKW